MDSISYCITAGLLPFGQNHARSIDLGIPPAFPGLQHLARTIGNGQTCGTCHVMTSEVESLSHSAHRDRSCLECHGKRGFLEKPIDEINPGPEARQTIQENCVACHTPILNTVHVAEKDSGKLCFDCHRETPHGRVHMNN